jgi:5'-3' exonuclease
VLIRVQFFENRVTNWSFYNQEFDNLYLDMNGIVHPCSHPEDGAPPETEEEMMLEVFKYTERVVNMVRPRKLLMIAVGMFNVRASQAVKGTCQNQSILTSGDQGVSPKKLFYFSLFCP